jgi:predicted component of type VI protein secretion system
MQDLIKGVIAEKEEVNANRKKRRRQENKDSVAEFLLLQKRAIKF